MRLRRRSRSTSIWSGMPALLPKKDTAYWDKVPEDIREGALNAQAQGPRGISL